MPPSPPARVLSWSLQVLRQAGLPALALPAEPSADALPIGIQLIGDYGTDDALLDLGVAFEAVAPWAQRRPAL